MTFERELAEQGIELLRASREREKARHGDAMLKKGPPVDRVGQRHPQRPARSGTTRRTSFAGVAVRIAQRLLAMSAAIWHNNKTGAPIARSVIAYDH